MSIAGRNKPNPKKRYSRLEITQAGRERLSRKRQKNTEYGDSGINAEGIAWEQMRLAGLKARAGMSNAERMADTAKGIRDSKILLDAEKKRAYEAGLGVNMYKRAVKKSYRDQQSKQDASILRERGKRANRLAAGRGSNPADRTSPSNVESIKDFFRDPGDKKYTSMDTGAGIISGGGYSVRRTQMTSSERRLAKLRAKRNKKPRANATL